MACHRVAAASSALLIISVSFIELAPLPVRARSLACAAGSASTSSARHHPGGSLADRACASDSTLASGTFADTEGDLRGADLSLLQVVAGARRSGEAAKGAAAVADAVSPATAAAQPGHPREADGLDLDGAALMQQNVTVSSGRSRSEGKAALADASADMEAAVVGAAAPLGVAAAPADTAPSAAVVALVGEAVRSVAQSASSATSGRSSLGAGTNAPSYLEATASEGDVVQGLVFTMICLIIVLGIYLLVFNDYRPGEVAYPMHFDGMENRQRSWPQGRPGSAIQAPSKFSSKSLASPEMFRGTSFGMPGTPATLPGTQVTILGNPPTSEDWYNELPMMYEQLVMPVAMTRLAVPLALLSTPSFEVDVLGLSGVPLLSAVLASSGRGRTIEISLHSVGTPVARVTQDLEILGADGRFVGVLKRDGALIGTADGPQLVLRDRDGRPILLLVATRKDFGGRDFAMRSVTDGVMKERATAVRRPAGRLPGEHYEVVAHPNVDAVLVLSVLLAAVVFESPYAGLSAPTPSGRPSVSTPHYASDAPAGSLLGLHASRPPTR
mmetsp:Transcript_63261/g.181950  ORF Transcript_63261/g.181950 Transcript_63261/m.181950 type:complete len:557 (+) Transcript_63261:128-1798(+)